MSENSKSFKYLFQVIIGYFRKLGYSKCNIFIKLSTILITSSIILASTLASASGIDSAYQSSTNSETAFWSELKYSDFDLALQKNSGEPPAVRQLQDFRAISDENLRSALGTTGGTNQIIAPAISSYPPSPTVGASSNTPESVENLPDPRRNRWKSVRKLEIAYQVLNLVDLAETIICINRNRCEELNPMIGRNPSNGRLVAYKLATGAVHYVVTRHLFNKHPDVLDEWMVGSLVLQGGVVMWNLQHFF